MISASVSQLAKLQHTESSLARSTPGGSRFGCPSHVFLVPRRGERIELCCTFDNHFPLIALQPAGSGASDAEEPLRPRGASQLSPRSFPRRALIALQSVSISSIMRRKVRRAFAGAPSLQETAGNRTKVREESEVQQARRRRRRRRQRGMCPRDGASSLTGLGWGGGERCRCRATASSRPIAASAGSGAALLLPPCARHPPPQSNPTQFNPARAAPRARRGPQATGVCEDCISMKRHGRIGGGGGDSLGPLLT
jgi:hypothetical protein